METVHGPVQSTLRSMLQSMDLSIVHSPGFTLPYCEKATESDSVAEKVNESLQMTLRRQAKSDSVAERKVKCTHDCLIVWNYPVALQKSES